MYLLCVCAYDTPLLEINVIYYVRYYFHMTTSLLAFNAVCDVWKIDVDILLRVDIRR